MDMDRKEKNKVYQLYGLFGAGLLLSLVPSASAAVITLVLFLGLLIGSYVLRGGAEHEGLLHNHATFIIITLWVAGGLAIPTMILGSVYMLANIDNSALNACMNEFISRGPAATQQSLPAMKAFFQPCLDTFYSANMQVLVISAAIAAGPVLVYTVYRFVKGLYRAKDGYRMAAPRSWF